MPSLCRHPTANALALFLQMPRLRWRTLALSPLIVADDPAALAMSSSSQVSCLTLAERCISHRVLRCASLHHDYFDGCRCPCCDGRSSFEVHTPCAALQDLCYMRLRPWISRTTLCALCCFGLPRRFLPPQALGAELPGSHVACLSTWSPGRFAI